MDKFDLAILQLYIIIRKLPGKLHEHIIVYKEQGHMYVYQLYYANLYSTNSFSHKRTSQLLLSLFLFTQ